MEYLTTEYKREQDLHSESEIFHYLYEMHHVMIRRLFCSHELVHICIDNMVSEVYARGEPVLFVTFFDDDGDTCHQILDFHEAVRIGMHRLEKAEARAKAVQEKRSQIGLVEPSDGYEDTSDEAWGCHS